MRLTLQRTALALCITAAPAALAQTGASIMLVPWAEDQVVDMRADAFYSPTESNVGGADVDLSIFDAVGRIRLHPGSSYEPTIGFKMVRYEIGSGDAALPDELTDVSVAFGGKFGDVDLGESLGGVWQMGYTVGVGYAGTNPFEDRDAYYFKADVYAVKPIDRDTRWLVGINYDGNRVFLPDVPLPAVTYFGRLSDTVTYGVGLPFTRLSWKPDDYWTVDIRSVLFLSFNGSVRYKATDDLDLFASYIRRNDAFTVSGGVDNRRLMFAQQRVELGLKYRVAASVDLTVAGGWAFDQEFDIGYDSRDPAGLRDLDDSAYIRAGIAFRY